MREEDGGDFAIGKPVLAGGSLPGRRSSKREYAYKGGLLVLSLITAASLYQNERLKHENELLRSETEYLAGEYLKASERPRLVLKNPKFTPARELDQKIFLREFNQKIFFEFRRDGDFDHILVETEAGYFQGKAGEVFSVGVTCDEFDDYVDGKPICFYVSEVKGIDIDRYKGVIIK